MTAATAKAKAAPIRWAAYREGEDREFHVADRLHAKLPGCWSRIDRDEDGEFTAIIYLGADLNRVQIGGYGGYKTAELAKGYVRDKVKAWLADIARVRFFNRDVNATCEGGERLYNAGLLRLIEATSDEGQVKICQWEDEGDYKLEFTTSCYEIRQRYRFASLDAAKDAARIMLASGPLPADDGYKRWPADER